MANTIVVSDLLQKETIRHLDKRLIVNRWANRKYEGALKQQGDTVRVQTFPDIEINVGGTAGDDITESDFAITSETLTIDKVAQVNVKLPDIQNVQSNLDLPMEVAKRVAYSKADLFDKYTTSFINDANSSNKLNLGSPATLTKTNIIEQIEDIKVALLNQNAFDNAGLFVNPETASLIRQSDLYSGFDKGLQYRSGIEVMRVAGFTVFETNNIPFKQKITIGANPAATDYIVVDGITYTFVSSIGTTAGNVLIGSTRAETQANLVSAITGGSGAGTTYVEVSSANRQIINNKMINLTDFSSDVDFFTANT